MSKTVLVVGLAIVLAGTETTVLALVLPRRLATFRERTGLPHVSERALRWKILLLGWVSLLAGVGVWLLLAR